MSMSIGGQPSHNPVPELANRSEQFVEKISGMFDELDGIVKEHGEGAALMRVEQSGKDANGKDVVVLVPMNQQKPQKEDIYRMSEKSIHNMLDMANKGNFIVVKKNGQLLVPDHIKSQIGSDAKFEVLEHPLGASARVDDVFGQVHPQAVRRTLTVTSIATLDAASVAKIQSHATAIFHQMRLDAEKEQEPLPLTTRTLSHMKEHEPSTDLNNNKGQKRTLRIVERVSANNVDLNPNTSSVERNKQIEKLFEQILHTNELKNRIFKERERIEGDKEALHLELVGAPQTVIPVTA